MAAEPACIVCGLREDEVEKMHYFPSSLKRTMHKIKETHLNPVMQYAMKVSIAAQILSHTVAAFLYSLISTGMVNQSVVATATFVKDVDTLFDSLNGRTLRAPEGKPLRCAIKEDSPHFQYWTEAHKKIKQWTFIRLNKNGTIKSSKPPSQIGWVTSLNAIREIWEYVHNKGFDHLRPRSLNQDPLENLFGGIRYGCGCSDNPTVKQFIGSLKTQILNGLTNQAFGKNCEDDDNTLLSNLKMFLNVGNVEESQESMLSDSTTIMNADENLDLITNEITASAISNNVNLLSVAYVAGFILKRLKNKFNCELCNCKLSSESLELHNIYIANKEWSDNKEALYYPSENLTKAVGSAITELELYLNQFASQPKIMVNTLTYLKNKINFQLLTCSNHKDILSEIILKAICKVGIPWWCKRKNQEIKSMRKERTASKRKITKFRHQ